MENFIWFLASLEFFDLLEPNFFHLQMCIGVLQET